MNSNEKKTFAHFTLFPRPLTFHEVIVILSFMVLDIFQKAKQIIDDQSAPEYFYIMQWALVGHAQIRLH